MPQYGKEFESGMHKSERAMTRMSHFKETPSNSFFFFYNLTILRENKEQMKWHCNYINTQMHADELIDVIHYLC